VKLPPRLTGLPMAVWITENDGHPHDVRVRISKAVDAGRVAAGDLRIVVRGRLGRFVLRCVSRGRLP
jgi:hypothetical protein